MADEIVVATTTNSTDDPVIEVARREGVGWFRGSEPDVLSRYRGAAIEFAADLIVRLTADCPLIDPETVDRVIADAVANPDQCDYVSNVFPRSYPRGLDTEALFRDCLDRVDRIAKSKEAREHVTHFIVRERPDLFLSRSVIDGSDNSDLRWTVDAEEDLELVRSLYARLELGDRAVSYADILNYVRGHPELMSINSHLQ